MVLTLNSILDQHNQANSNKLYARIYNAQISYQTLGTSLLCYAAVLKFWTYYAQYYAHVKDLC